MLHYLDEVDRLDDVDIDDDVDTELEVDTLKIKKIAISKEYDTVRKLGWLCKIQKGYYVRWTGPSLRTVESRT